MKVHEAMARAVAEEGVGAVFTLLGNANMELLASLQSAGGPKQYQGRIEGAVVTMAEGYARATGKVGLASVTSGPGLSNATNALACASRNKVPMVIITGHPADRHHQQYLHQEGLANLVGAKYIDVKSAGGALDAVKEAFFSARTESRPVLLDVSRSMAMSEFPWDFDYTPSTDDLAPPRRLIPDPTSLDEVLQLIAQSSKPVILAGRGALASDAKPELLALAAEIGAVLTTSLWVKNWFANEPYDVGVSGLFSLRYTGEIVADADLVIGFGASMNTHTLEGGYLFPAAQYVQVDTRPNVLLGTGKRADCFVNGDAKTTAAALLEGVKERGLAGERFRTAGVREQIVTGKSNPDPATFDIEPDRADGRRIVNAVDEVFSEDAGIVISNGHCWGLVIPEFTRWKHPQLYSGAFGSIGMALPTAVGAAIAEPGKPIIHFEGDGGFMMNLHTIDTVVQYDLPVFTVVMNDASFGAEEHQMKVHGFDESLAYQNAVDFAEVARAMGCRSVVVRSEEEMRAAAQEFLANPGPFLVDARISRNVISVPFRRLHYGIEA